jgi:hypothetical protein
VLTVGDVDMPPKRDFFVRVFLNKPDVSADTPIDDPHYAGSFGFFFDESGMKSQEGAAGMRAGPLTGFLIDATPTLQKLNQAGSLSSNEAQGEPGAGALCPPASHWGAAHSQAAGVGGGPVLTGNPSGPVGITLIGMPWRERRKTPVADRSYSEEERSP